ncbi:MAG: family 78 glycoside hydrolase catalytic domain [Oscillospiraceae bacterium]|nr:family 78 glycoside hydrolase catalytic domain [Oscillospiraceae bacterium]
MLTGARWITPAHVERSEPTHTGCPSPLLRKGFTADKPVASAQLRICGLGLGVYYLNGRRVTEDVLTTPVTKYDATILFQDYDVTTQLQQGENALGVILGNGWYNNTSECWGFEKATWRANPKLIGALRVEYTDGSTLLIQTDRTWKTHDGPITFNQTRSGETYDARLEIPGWNTAGFDDTAWRNAVVCSGGGGLLLPMDALPPIRIQALVPAKALGDGVYDLGVNISGWCRIRANCEAGRQITLHFVERLEEAGNLASAHTKHQDTYITKGGGEEQWEPYFVYHGFRYVKAEGAPEQFELEGRVLHTDLASVGTFACSDAMLNQIHAASRRSTLENWHSIPTDCPHREQNGWTGDALMSAEQSIMNFDMTGAYRKWLRDLRDAQRPNGQVPAAAPSSGHWGWGWGSGPAWDSALIQIPYFIYKYAGDASALRDNWDSMELYMTFMESMSEGYFVDYGLGDWCPPENAKPCRTVVTDTAYYYANAVIMAKSAAALGRDGSAYAALAQKIRQAFRQAFVRGGIVEDDSQTAIACGIYQGLLEPEELAAAAKRLAELVAEKDYHIDCGILGAKYIFSALSNNGYADVLYKMVTNPTYPSYAHWINSGMTTLVEDWDMKSSQNHHMFSEVDMWFYRHVAGIQIDEDALVIQPCFLQDLAWVKATHRDISVAWDAQELRVTMPRSCTVIVDGQSHQRSAGTWVFARG